MIKSLSDVEYMRLAMELAENGKGFVNPNPLVGALIVKDGRIIGRGWHEYYGGLHAERNAFKNCTESAEGATMYVTLEPCCHYGKTPPCTEAIVENKIAKVVVGLKDPNPRVAGKGIEILRQAGIEVITGIEEDSLRKQNRIFLKYITTGRPWVVMKTAMTLDGKIAATTGDSKWVSGEESRHLVQKMRSEYMGIMVGINTVRLDDPMLNSRLEGNVRQPVRIVVDSKASISAESKLLQSANEYKTIIVHTEQADSDRLAMIKSLGAETLLCDTNAGQVDIEDMLGKLGKQGIDSILLEGGGELNYSFIRTRMVDEVNAFIAPKYIGGRDSKTPVEGDGIEKMADALELQDASVEVVGRDILVNGIISKDRLI
ncbi:bifunctional diaminohydroxyphosphoribosylaminopyrimidine deaminase/5-amino-6-(5-phosphoribosylamino)uracil reductase RibD [Porphyromonadaceae bacterium OttesenSCG-928-L07]|nr:bifunctional diaminohydroxyphosphoribosylaminopyrimidine deaminase/5-amino-6-(5-phosphoribosylamino)uracil reductase RibD [Porphyromonadaceae bacterium OttesenSCG-928-L07]